MPTGAAAAKRWSLILWLATAAVGLFLGLRQLAAYRLSGQDSWFAMLRALDFMHGPTPGLVYQTLLFTHHIKFQYPPTGLLLLDLMNSLHPMQYAQLNFINDLALLASGLLFAIFAYRTLGEVKWAGISIPIAPLAFIVAIKFYPEHYGFVIGQIQILLGLLFLLACLAVLDDRPVLAGVLMGVAATIKPQFLVFGVLALWRREWRFLWAFALVTVVALVIAVVLYGLPAQISYYRDVLPYLSRHGECYHINASVNGVLNRYLEQTPCVDSDPHADPNSPILSSWFPPYNATVYIATLASSLLLLIIPFTLAADRRDRLFSVGVFCIAGAAFTMASPIAWVHHYNVLLPGFLVAIRIAIDQRTGPRQWLMLGALVVAFILTGVALSDPFAPTDPSRNLLQSHVFFGACLMLGLLLALTRGRYAALPPDGGSTAVAAK